MTDLIKPTRSSLNVAKVRLGHSARILAEWKRFSKDQKADWHSVEVYLSESECLEVEERFTKDLEDLGDWISQATKQVEHAERINALDVRLRTLAKEILKTSCEDAIEMSEDYKAESERMEAVARASEQ